MTDTVERRVPTVDIVIPEVARPECIRKPVECEPESELASKKFPWL